MIHFVFSEINNLGGVVSAIEQGYQQREISKAASIYQHKIDNNKRIVVGVNEFINDIKNYGEKWYEYDLEIIEIFSKKIYYHMKYFCLYLNYF